MSSPACAKGRCWDTGAKWAGVWTRDLAYSAHLALCLIDPERVKNGLRRKVADGRIVQDTGTGGSWPVSTDRVVWALAAWELFCATGDLAWAQEAEAIIAATLADDERVTRSASGLSRGESSFLDWREQSYPKWMQPADIAASECLGTNATYHAAWRALASFRTALGGDAAPAQRAATGLATAINAQLWIDDARHYGQFRYGRTVPIVSPRWEALGNALCVLEGIAPAERARALIAATPAGAYGVPTLHPQQPEPKPYHNDSVWPFAHLYWTWAAAEAGDEAALAYGLGTYARAIATFGSNMENFVARTGQDAGTAINSKAQLWSIAATLALHLRVLGGVRLDADRIRFAPAVPAAWTGERRISGLRWRDAVIDLTVRGHGRGIAGVTIDGKPAERAEITATAKGPVTVIVTLDGKPFPGASGFAVQPWRAAPATPVAALTDVALTWKPVANAARYQVLRDGVAAGETTDARFAVDAAAPAAWQVIALATDGTASFASEPLIAGPADAQRTIPWPGAPLKHAGAAPAEIDLDVPAAGRWFLCLRYGLAGSLVTGSGCAVRRVAIAGKDAGTVALPQRGDGKSVGESTWLAVDLAAGRQRLAVSGDAPKGGNAVQLHGVRLVRRH